MGQKEELKQRVIAKRKELEAQIARLRADSSEASRKEVERLQKQLNHARETIKQNWDKVTDDAAKKINEWLKK
ncbi:MAG: hypothetical protein KC543_05215 [Myxococcales bacterium]|nr:hypothetical protein [Myxococcales bacterium]